MTVRSVVEAQRLNIARMSDAELRRELRLVTGFPERPPIRQVYIEQMVKEFARRRMSMPESA